jgi:hypothetical protein
MYQQRAKIRVVPIGGGKEKAVPNQVKKRVMGLCPD